MMPRSANHSSTSQPQGEPDITPDRLLDDFGREAVAAIADLAYHRWLRLKSLNGKPTDNVTRPPELLFRPDAVRNAVDDLRAILGRLERGAERPFAEWHVDDFDDRRGDRTDIDIGGFERSETSQALLGYGSESFRTAT
jgi:hypothetical protein